MMSTIKKKRLSCSFYVLFKHHYIHNRNLSLKKCDKLDNCLTEIIK